MVLDGYRSLKVVQSDYKLFENRKSLLHVWAVFGCFRCFGVLWTGSKSPKYAAKDTNLISVWVGDDDLKHSIMHEK